jgi:murein DD-endopeptidase MepM/ murein hydrolase activator NlpD
MKKIHRHKCRQWLKVLFFCFLAAGLQISASAQHYHPNLDVRITKLPPPVSIGGKQVMYYEMYVTNFGVDSIRLKQLRIANPHNYYIFTGIGNEHLQERMARIGSQGKVYSDMIPPGCSLVIYVELEAGGLFNRRGRLEHRLIFETKAGTAHSDDSVAVMTAVDPAASVILGPPLGSGNWAAVYEPSWRTGHRRVIYTINGHAGIPGRYAIDFIKLDDKGRLSRGNDDFIKDWYGYGADVLAVADGEVASLRNDFSETPTVSGHERITAENATGNYISIRLKNGQYAFYEHLKPGSIVVKPGQKVTKGQVIAAIGFTGQSQGPHLHFHIADKNSPLGAEGMPFSFDHFTYSGVYTKIDSLGKSPWRSIEKIQETKRSRERPLPNSVIRFK